MKKIKVYLRNAFTKIPVYLNNLVTIITTGFTDTMVFVDSEIRIVLEMFLRFEKDTMVFDDTDIDVNLIEVEKLQTQPEDDNMYFEDEEILIKLARYRLLSEMDDLVLSEFDDMTLGDVDYIFID